MKRVPFVGFCRENGFGDGLELSHLFDPKRRQSLRRSSIQPRSGIPARRPEPRCPLTFWLRRHALGVGVSGSALEPVTVVSVLGADSRDEAEGPLLPEEEGHSDMASFQPTDSDVPSFLEDCNRVTAPFIFVISHLVTAQIFNIDMYSSGDYFSLLLTATSSLLLLRPNYLVVSIRFGLI